MLYYAFSERLKHVISKLTKLPQKMYMWKNTGNPKMKNLKPLNELLSSYFEQFLIFFFQKMSHIVVYKDFDRKLFNAFLNEI